MIPNKNCEEISSKSPRKTKLLLLLILFIKHFDLFEAKILASQNHFSIDTIFKVNSAFFAYISSQ